MAQQAEGTQLSPGKRFSNFVKNLLSNRLTRILTGVLLIAAIIYAAVTYAFMQQAMEDKALAEARTLNDEIMASWDYIDSIQDRINYSEPGIYEFKHVYCSIAGKRIAMTFTARNESGCSIRFTREDPRSYEDAPDTFEAAALATFEAGEQTEQYGVENESGTSTFRYIGEIRISYGCLTCHGTPAGEIDETGFVKEGMQIGDLAGGVSISIPLNAYINEAVGYTLLSLLVFFILWVIMMLIIYFATNRTIAAPLEQKNEELQAVSDAKSEMLSIVNHELRTPLTSIITYTDMLERNISDDPQKQRETIEEIKQNSELLLSMVNSTIDVGKIDAGKYMVTIEAVDICDVVAAVDAVAMPLATKEGIIYTSLIEQDVPIVLSDWETLRRIVANLVDNAIKYTNSGGEAHLHVQYDFSANALVITMQDTGIGIAEDEIDLVFERFERSPMVADERYASGSGLGLSLIKSLAEFMGGSVHVESILGEGSTFTVTIPAEAVDD